MTTAILLLAGLAIGVAGTVAGFRGDLHKALAESPAMPAAERAQARALAGLLHSYAGLLLVLGGLTWLGALARWLVVAFVR